MHRPRPNQLNTYHELRDAVKLLLPPEPDTRIIYGTLVALGWRPMLAQLWAIRLVREPSWGVRRQMVMALGTDVDVGTACRWLEIVWLGEERNVLRFWWHTDENGRRCL